MSLVSVDVKPNAPTSLQVNNATGISVDVGPAIVQSVAVADANGQYSVELAMVALGPQGAEGKPGRVVDVLGTFGMSKTPADLPADGLIPVEWDASKSPPKTIQFAIGDALTYLPQDTTNPLYGHNFAYTGGAYGSPWLDCGVLRGEKGDTGATGSVGPKGDTGATGASNVLTIGNVATGSTAAASITGTSPSQTLNLVLPKGDKGNDGHSPIITMTGDQIVVDGVPTGPHLTGPQGPQGETGRSLTILGYYATEIELYAAHPTGNLGDAYIVGAGYLYVWGASGWVNAGQLQGPKGDTGATGATGPANTLSVGAVTSGATPSVTIRGASPNQIIDFVLQKGDKGDPGATGATGSAGPANTLDIGTVIAGATASATITGTAPNQTLNLVLPKGDTGSAGAQGPKGDTGATGATGSAGPANTLAIGTVSSGGSAAASITGAAPNQTLNLVLPKGDTGAQGPAGSDAIVTKTNVVNALGYTPPYPTGSGASGTWPISISGSASSASTASSATTASSLAANPTLSGTVTVSKLNYPTADAIISLAGASIAAWGAAKNFTIYAEAYKPNGGSWVASSDSRLKKGIKPLGGCLETIKKLKPVSFSWALPMNGENTDGFIAQDVAKVFPSAVREYTPPEVDESSHFREHLGGDGSHLAVGFGNDFYAYLVGAIQELSDKVDDLQDEIGKLKAA